LLFPHRRDTSFLIAGCPRLLGRQSPPVTDLAKGPSAGTMKSFATFIINFNRQTGLLQDKRNFVRMMSDVYNWL
jgi:hypothetical protein